MQKETGPKSGQEKSYSIALGGPSRRTATDSAGPELSQEQEYRRALPTT